MTRTSERGDELDERELVVSGAPACVGPEQRPSGGAPGANGRSKTLVVLPLILVHTGEAGVCLLCTPRDFVLMTASR